MHLTLPGAAAAADRKGGDIDAAKKNGKAKKPVHNEVRERFVLDEIDPHCTLENFIVTEGNLLAGKLFSELCGFDLEAKQETSAPPALNTFNPIYVYGEAGSGKTHLLMAAAHLLRKKGLKVVYARAETFIGHIINAMRNTTVQELRKTYRQLDVLIVDGIQAFSRKSACQEEFFHTFNTLHQDGKQLVLSADVYPQNLESIEARLVSRFEWGITLPVQSLAVELLPLFCQKKAQHLGLQLDKKVIEFLCQTFSKRLSSLTKALEALALRNHMQQGNSKSPAPLDLFLAKRYLTDLVDEEKQKALTSDIVLGEVARAFGVPVGEVLGRSQSRECAYPRQVAMFLLRKHLKMPFTQIGSLFQRNHSTVMTSIKQIQKQCDEKQTDLVATLARIEKTIS